MKSFGVALLACVAFSGCARANYTLQTRTETRYGGRTYVIAEVLNASKKVVGTYPAEMVPGDGRGFNSEGTDQPPIELRMDFDLEGRGANVTLDVSHERVASRFVPRPLPPGFERPNPKEGIPKPRVVQRVAPIFPTSPPHNRYPVRVLVDAMIRSDGTVESVQVLNPDPKHDGLDEAAALAVRLWQFEPPRRKGVFPVGVAAVQVVEFRR